MDARESNNRCKTWRKQDCTNCQHLSKESAYYFYKTNRRLWYAGRGNPLTGENCEGCELKEFTLAKQLIERIKMDTSDVFETIGCLNVETVARRRDIVIMLESIAENVGSCTSRADIIGLKAKEIDREAPACSMTSSPTLDSFVVLQKGEAATAKSDYL